MQIISSLPLIAAALSACVGAAPTQLEMEGRRIPEPGEYIEGPTRTSEKRNLDKRQWGLSSITAYPAPAPTTKPGGYKRTWWENFTHASGLAENWQVMLGHKYPTSEAPDNWGTGEIQRYTNHPDNIKIVNQTLVIQPMQRVVDGQLRWTSARIEGKNDGKRIFGAEAGKKMLLETAIKFGSAAPEKAHGIWPAFWAMSQDFRDRGFVGWPETGEWDIAEAIMGQRTQYGLVHCDVAPGGACNEPTGLGANWYIPRGVWLRVGFEVDRTNSDWRQQTLKWYLNGELKHTITGANINKQAVWTMLAHKKYFIIANVACGGAWADYLAGGPGQGSPNANTLQNRYNNLEIDWMAVFNT